MYLRLNPDKEKSRKDKDDIAKAYRPGDCVIPLGNGQGDGSVSGDETRPWQVGGSSEVEGRRRRAERIQRRTERRAQRHQQPEDSAASSIAISPPSTVVTRPPRPLGHSSSLRSILSNSDVGELHLQEEIIQQIEEEGMLDGIDIENMTADQEEDFTERIVAAYRRRLQDNESRRIVPLRAQHQPNLERHAYTSHVDSPPNTRLRPVDLPSRPRTTSSGRTDRSQEAVSRRDSPRTRTNSTVQQPVRNSRDTRPSTDVDTLLSNLALPSGRSLSSSPSSSAPVPRGSARTRRPRPAVASVPSGLQFERRSLVRPSGTTVASTLSNSLSRHDPVALDAIATAPPVVYASVDCSHCGRADIEHDLHYTCGLCRNGHFALCRYCYRLGQGCDDWTGPGYRYFSHYLKGQTVERTTIVPHILQPRRLVHQGNDEHVQAQAGLFCDGCSSYADQCYWHCRVCNDGAWGYCNPCVQKGKHCTHLLEAIAHQRYLDSDQAIDSVPDQDETDPVSVSLPVNVPLAAASSAHAVDASHAITTQSSPGIAIQHIPDPGNYRLAIIRTTCDLCRQDIISEGKGYHCPECSDGNFDICKPCYQNLVSRNRISPQNGPRGWRRCPRGHRMVVIEYTAPANEQDPASGTRGLQRRVFKDVVGGRASVQPDDVHFGGPTAMALENYKPATPVSSPAADPANDDTLRPPPTGISSSLRLRAVWSYFPDAATRDSDEDIKDELQFPRGAEITDAIDENGEWFWGVYAGMSGFFPAAYCRIVA